MKDYKAVIKACYTQRNFPSVSSALSGINGYKIILAASNEISFLLSHINYTETKYKNKVGAFFKI